MQEIDSIGDFDAKKSEPLFWWQSQKHRTTCFGVSFLQVYWETRISKILSIHLWIVGPETVLIWPVVVWSGIAQWRLRVPKRLWKSPILGSSRLASTMSRKALPLWTSGTWGNRGHIELSAGMVSKYNASFLPTLRMLDLLLLLVG